MQTMVDEKPKLKKGADYTGVATVFACHDGNGKFLFARRGDNVRDGHGMWEIPAGGVKFGEKVRDGLIRELREELCTEPVAIEEIGYKDVIERDGDFIKKHWVTFEFLIKVDPSTVQIGEPESCAAIEWRGLDDAPAPLHFGVAETIANIKAFLATKT
jgi:ADP-ribose pyrophosphatase YjhB (NUDIX family)